MSDEVTVKTAADWYNQLASAAENDKQCIEPIITHTADGQVLELNSPRRRVAAAKQIRPNLPARTGQLLAYLGLAELVGSIMSKDIYKSLITTGISKVTTEPAALLPYEAAVLSSAMLVGLEVIGTNFLEYGHQELLSAALRVVHHHLNENNGLALYWDDPIASEITDPGSGLVTFWSALAVHLALRTASNVELPDSKPDLERLLAIVAMASELRLCHAIANQHAGNTSTCDPADTLYWVGAVCISGSSPEREKMAQYAISLVFAESFSDGVLKTSRSSLGPTEGRAAVLCSTTEILLSVMIADSLSHRPGHIVHSIFGAIFSHFSWLDKNRKGDLYRDDRDLFGEHTGYATLCAVCFTAYATRVADTIRDLSARKILGVQPHQPGWRHLTYPESISNFISKYTILPIKNGDRRRAFLSMILYGPPGTSKTSIVKKIAYDLNWPLLEITQKHVLGKGAMAIDAAIEEIFHLCGYLRDVVILFDELEELILERNPEAARESRLLTTSMLPRIHDLRDGKRVVFAFATNRPDSLDIAATRLGRFDIVKFVPPLSQADKASYFAKQASGLDREYPSLGRALRDFLALNPLEQERLTSMMSYGELNYFLIKMQRHIDEGGAATLMELCAAFGEFRPTPAYKKVYEVCRDFSAFDRPK